MSTTTLHYRGTHPITIKGFGWINATQAAQMSKGKIAEEWLTSSGGLYALEQLAGELGTGFVPGFFDIHRVQRDRQNFLLALRGDGGLVRTAAGDTKQGGGLWLHPNLALSFARWLDADKIDHPFAAWLAEQLPEVRHQHAQTAKAKREAEAEDLAENYVGAVGAELLEQMRTADVVLRNAGASVLARRRALACMVAQAQGDSA
ncbi:KilA-N domain protein [compost metagenome]